MNSPVFSPSEYVGVPLDKSRKDELVLGYVPGTSVPVRARFRDLLEYHTAILGVTGTGKTEMAFEIIRQGLNEDTKIFCVDFTGEYQSRLGDLNPEFLSFSEERMNELEKLVFAIETGQYKSEKEKIELKKWEDKVRPEVAKTVDDFLKSPGKGLGIFELPEISNTRATLRATELYLTAIFNWARQNRRKRRILIVLEEAHTVIPETSFFSYDKGETQTVVGKMAQIALQGRKYGVGILLVSQRTAHVSKNLLSQCNTYVSFSLFDKTSLDYLSSVFSEDHVRTVPRLGFLQAVAFGKGILTHQPILLQIPEDPKKKIASEDMNVERPNEREETLDENVVL